MASELMECPFCGTVPNADRYYADQGDKWGRVVCGCGAQGPDTRTQYDMSENAEWHKDADELWNTRTPPAGPVVWVARDGGAGRGTWMFVQEPRYDSELREWVATDEPPSLGAIPITLGLAPGECRAYRLLEVEG